MSALVLNTKTSNPTPLGGTHYTRVGTEQPERPKQRQHTSQDKASRIRCASSDHQL
jgi:hypothetical protein